MELIIHASFVEIDRLDQFTCLPIEPARVNWLIRKDLKTSLKFHRIKDGDVGGCGSAIHFFALFNCLSLRFHFKMTELNWSIWCWNFDTENLVGIAPNICEWTFIKIGVGFLGHSLTIPSPVQFFFAVESECFELWEAFFFDKLFKFHERSPVNNSTVNFLDEFSEHLFDLAWILLS